MGMKDGAIGQRAEGTNPLKGEQPTLENSGGGSVQGGGMAGVGDGVRRGSDNHQRKDKKRSKFY